MNESLHDQIEHLHRELARAPAVDAAARESLVALLTDITRLLQASSARTAELAEEVSISQRMESVAVQFESEHPHLSAAIRGVVDALARAGI